MTVIKVCLGSSCFARGNARVVQIIRSYLRRHSLDHQVELTGTLCEDCCGDGPMMFIGSTSYSGISPGVMEDILRQVLPPPQQDDGGSS